MQQKSRSHNHREIMISYVILRIHSVAFLSGMQWMIKFELIDARKPFQSPSPPLIRRTLEA